MDSSNVKDWFSRFRKYNKLVAKTERPRKGRPLLFELDAGYEAILELDDTGIEVNTTTTERTRERSPWLSEYNARYEAFMTGRPSLSNVSQIHPLLFEPSVGYEYEYNFMTGHNTGNEAKTTTTERTRKGLPLLFESHAGYEEIMTGHDTGTEANHMSLQLAQKLGYELNTEETSRAQFQLPNGKIIVSIGRVTARVQFAQGAGSRTSSFTCDFNVFSHLALPALIGMAFLNATETLTTYRSRLATLPAGWKRSLRLCAVGNATNQVTCVLDGREVIATADTGAEISLVSGKYAARHGLLRHYSCEELELADGSWEYTSGFGDLELSIRRPRAYEGSDKQNDWTTKTVQFHVLQNLHFDVILDEGIIEDFKIFHRGFANVLSAATSILPSLGPIAHLGKLERSIIDAKGRVKGWCSSLLSSKSDTSMYSLRVANTFSSAFLWSKIQ